MAEKLEYETQKQRWIKYGANVVIASIVVILLAGIIVYLAQRTGKRIDTSEARAYSIKPQTLNILKDVKQKMKQLASAETQKVAKLPVDQLPQDDESQLAATAVMEVRRFPKLLSSSADDIGTMLTDKPPNYKGAVDEINERMQFISEDSGRI